jgi:hypothetical protein
MSIAYIHRIRSDHSIALQPALSTPTPGVYLARAVATDSRSGSRATWQLRLRCGIALGDFGYELSFARQLATALGALDVDWRGDYSSLQQRFNTDPALHLQVRRMLSDRISGRVAIGGAA